MNMNKTMKTLTVAAALAVMIPLSAYAATSSTTPSNSSTSNATKDTLTIHKGKALGDGPFTISHEGFGGGGLVSQDVLDLLKLDRQALKDKLDAGKTLAQIAQDQGVSRDDLKKAISAAFDKRQAQEKQEFTSNLDKTVDGQFKFGQGMDGGHFGGRGFGAHGFGKIELTAAAKLLGLSEADLKQALTSGKSLADIAKEKGVNVQTLIDAQKQTIVDGLNAAVKAGKLTQEQADKAIADAGNIAEKIVNGTEPIGGPGHGRGPWGARGGHPGDGPADAAPDAADGSGA